MERLKGTKEILEGAVIDLERIRDELISKAEQMETEQTDIITVSYGNDIETNQNILYGIQRIIKLIKRQLKN